jgi:LAS superfamily LD-carboxypeptidase LdcB
MSSLPGFVVHQWVVEANKLTLVPIAVSLDGRQMHLARPETVNAYNRMATDAAKAGVSLKVIWAYRSVSTQVQQMEVARRKHGKRGALKWLAPPGFSEHHTGWALDIGDEKQPQADDNPLFEKTNAFRWLSKNAGRYGFEMSFPPSNWQGVSYEPWHWRFVGTPEAMRTFHPTGMTKMLVWSLSLFEALKRFIIT